MGKYAKHAAALTAAGAASAAAGILLAPSLWLLWLLLAAVALAAAWHFYNQYTKARIGYRSEKSTAKKLQNSNSCQVLINSCMLGAGGDADHVALGPGAVVIETKTGFGQLRVSQGRVYSGKRLVGKNEIEQVTRQARALERILNVPVTKVVCVADARGNIQRTGDVIVCNARDLPAVVSTAPTVLSARDLPAAVEKVLKVHQRNN